MYCCSGPAPTTGVPVVVTGHDTVEPTVSATCDVFPLYYLIKYRLSSSTGDYTTVKTSGTTSVTLQDLTPNTEYDVEVAAIFSNGAISNSLLAAHFTVAPTTAALPSEIYYYVFLFIIIHYALFFCIIIHFYFIAIYCLPLIGIVYMQLYVIVS